MTVMNGLCPCGYIAVPPGHPWWGKSEDEIETSVHGGLTYSSSMDDFHRKTMDWDEMFGDWWVLGFDCGHYDDFVNPKGEAFVAAECQRLAAHAQLRS